MASGSLDLGSVPGSGGGGSGITALTGDVTASGSGSVVATIAAGAVTNAQQANMVNNTIKGNQSGSTGAPSDLTVSQLIKVIYAQGTQTISASAIDWSTGLTFTKSITSTNTTFTFSNTLDTQEISVLITSTTGTVTWPTVKWQGGVIPTQTVNGSDLYFFEKIGSSIYGSVIQAVA